MLMILIVMLTNIVSTMVWVGLLHLNLFMLFLVSYFWFLYQSDGLLCYVCVPVYLYLVFMGGVSIINVRVSFILYVINMLFYSIDNIDYFLSFFKLCVLVLILNYISMFILFYVSWFLVCMLLLRTGMLSLSYTMLFYTFRFTYLEMPYGLFSRFNMEIVNSYTLDVIKYHIRGIHICRFR